MRSISSTTRSDRHRLPTASACIGLLVVLGGCATESVTTDHPPEFAPPAPVAPPREPKPPVLGLEYGNRSTRATLQLDLGDEDVQVEMSGNPARREAQSEDARAAQASRSAPPTTDDPGAVQARRIVDSASPRPSRASVPDSVTRRVVGDIRKGQEAFYKGRYQETFDLALRSIAVRPTPEGCALAGSAAWVLKDRESARRYWSQARALDPDFPGIAAMLDSLPPSGEDRP